MTLSPSPPQRPFSDSSGKTRSIRILNLMTKKMDSDIRSLNLTSKNRTQRANYKKIDKFDSIQESPESGFGLAQPVNFFNFFIFRSS